MTTGRTVANDTGLGCFGTPAMPWRRSSDSSSSPMVGSARPCSSPTTGRRPPRSSGATIFARHVAAPFQGQAAATLDAKSRARASCPQLAESNIKVVEASTAKYEAELQQKRA